MEAQSYLEELSFWVEDTRRSPFTEEYHCNGLPSAKSMDDEARLFDITPRLCTSSRDLALWQEPPVKHDALDGSDILTEALRAGRIAHLSSRKNFVDTEE